VASGQNEERWASWMRAGLAGDGATYRRLLEELAGVLRRMVRAALARAGRGNADIEDIVQETLLAIHLKRETWDPALPFSPWFHAVARYKVIDSLRRAGVRASLPIEDFTEVLAAPEAMSTDLGDAERLMEKLEERPRAIVQAISIEGQSTGEVARRLSMSEGAVRVALHRALKALAQIYRQQGGQGHEDR
jgi:RNA polymerase sigma-70 factor, ECF subfamily